MMRWIAPLAAGLLLGCAHRAIPPHNAPSLRVPARDRATTPEQNLVAFARVYGYVRFFHPTDASHEADWRRLAVLGVRRVRDAPTVDALAERLEALFHPLAPSLQLWVDGEPVPAVPAAPHPRDGLVYWQYQGFPGSTITLYTPPYSKVRVQPEQSWRRRFAEAPARDARVEAELLPQLRMRLPLVLSAEQAERAAAHPTADPGVDLDRDLEVLAVREAAVIEVWNVLRHFYPYQQELALDWEQILVAALHDVEDDTCVDDLRDSLRGLLEPLEDGHGYVGHVRHGTNATLPVRLEVIEGKAVVTGTRDPEHFAVGDVVERIGDERALDKIGRIASLLSGTPQWRQFRASAWESARAQLGERVELVVERDGARRHVTAEAERVAVPISPRPPGVHAFDDGVVYVDLTRVGWAELKVQLPLLAAAPGVVFDMRGYPEDNDTIIDHLLEQPEDSLWMHVPRIVAPDGEVVGWHDLGWHRRPAEPHIGAPVSFLVSAEAISYAESMMSYVEAHELGTIVGTRTAGANGDIVRFDTLAGFYVVYSGMRVTRHDGTPFHRGGVTPDLQVDPTIAGLRAGRDEVLEAGLATVRAAMPAPALAARKTRRAASPHRPIRATSAGGRPG